MSLSNAQKDYLPLLTHITKRTVTLLFPLYLSDLKATIYISTLLYNVQSYNMSNLTKLEFAALDVNGKNYMSWTIDVKMHLESMGILDTLNEINLLGIADKINMHSGIKHNSQTRRSIPNRFRYNFKGV
ncbi:hypothetical protein OSB04_024256 [Centaurea solstitialis]|uniref:Uncharacterized protein n=1 Tax=Centaurea solstitialis TaxID=347529 RepID=A0AA38WBW4_9ASTR|nr:hypothetical protein OSB04_024256 [Centaurea solstitialis]